jgi:PAS domain S-box-containing protein
MTRPLNILIVEDNAVDAELALNALRDHGYEVQWQRVETEAAFLAALANSPDLILSDYSMPRFDGLRALTLVRGSGLDTPFILISGTLGEVAAVEAIKLGADDYLLKDRTARLGPAVGRALEGRRLRRERFHMEDSLKDAETRLRLATEASNIGAWDWNLLTDEVYFSPEWKRQLGYEDHELTNEFSEWESRLHPEDHDRILSDVAAFRADPDKGYDVDYRLRHKDGSYRWIHTQAMLMHDTTGRALRMLGCHVDITSRKQAEQRLNRLNRLHAVQSEIGETIVRTRNREALFEAICRILVQTGQLRLAMLTELEPATGRVLPAARCGADREFLREIKVAVDEGLLGCGTIGTVLRTGRSDCCNDLSMDPRMEPWREAALRQGVGSIAAFPLSCNATIIGALVLFAAEPQYFQDDELRLMEAVAGSISFALEALRGEQKLREQAALLDKAQDAIIVRDLQHHITYWNRSAERLYGWTAEEAVGRSIKELIYRDTAAFMAATEVTLSKGGRTRPVDQGQPAGGG